MGPSGSGKTTLLDVLAGRKTVGTLEGDVRFAGHAGSREFIRRYTGYVEQFGALGGGKGLPRRSWARAAAAASTQQFP